MDKAELLEKLQAEHERFLETLSRLTEDELTRPLMPDGLTVKDTIIHVAIWNRRGTGWLASAARGERPDAPAPGATWDDMDRMNEESRLENLHVPLNVALAEYRDSYRQLAEQLRAMPEAVWDDEYVLAGDTEPTRVSRIAEWRLNHLAAHSRAIYSLADGI